MWNRFKTFDFWLYLIPLVFMGISCVVIYTLTLDNVGFATTFKQLTAALVGIVAMIALAFIDYRAFKAWAFWLYLIVIVLLVLVMVIGKSDFGAQRWIDIGFTQIQPSELAKLATIVGLAAIFSRKMPKVSWNTLLFALSFMVIPGLLILAQPDLGSALVVLISGIVLVFHSKLSKAQRMLMITGIGLVVLIFTLSFMEIQPFAGVLKEYQKDRLASFIEPARDESGTGYNVMQSVIAVGSGGVVGKGLGEGSQSQLNFLPVAHADFIFAGIAEAWGLVGSAVIIGLYAILISRILQAAKIAKDDFGMLIAVGVAAKIAIEMLVNIGMNIRLMPVTGIPLPFLSYGGTTMVVNAMCIGLVQSIVIRYKRLTFES